MPQNKTGINVYGNCYLSFIIKVAINTENTSVQSFMDLFCIRTMKEPIHFFGNRTENLLCNKIG